VSDSLDNFFSNLASRSREAEINNEIFNLELKDFIESSPPETLVFIRKVFSRLTFEDGPQISNYLIGRVDGEMYRRDLCPSCGKNHLSEGLAGHMGAPEEAFDPATRSESPQEDILLTPEGENVFESLQKQAEENISKNIKELDVTVTPLLVYCNRCKETWHSLEDRMNDIEHTHA
jgi:hypothetical protein